MNKKAPTFSLKDQLFNREKIEYISRLISKSYPDFLQDNFIAEVVEEFPNLELTQRITHISEVLKKYLPEDFEESVNILLESLPEPDDNWTLDNNFGDFIFAPFSEFVATYWLEDIDKNWLEFCLSALEKMTPNFSCEYSIRPFINTYEEETLDRILEWSQSDNYHVRRLASEWSRPKLPWWKKINIDYRKCIKILDNLYCDDSRFVTRSVANHLNDISKLDPELVVNTLKRWSSPQNSPQGEGVAKDIDYIISHSTRWLVKQGHKETLELLGYSSNPKVNIANLGIKNDIVKIWDSLEFEFELNPLLTSPHGRGIKQNLIIDYKIYFKNKSWVLKAKVFKIKKLILQKTIQITKKHPLKMMTTKALYEWEHQVEIIINWKSFWKKSFELKK